MCQTGFTGNGTYCADFDECALGTHSCHGNAVCVNVIGSYTCFCNAGYTGDGVNCTIIPVNRTLVNTTTFPPSKSTNSTGNYSTDGNVTLGKNPDVTKCYGNISCHASGRCHNMSGFMDCKCNAGFNGNGVNCSDIDECSETVLNCGVNAHCVNTIGSYVCECDSGYLKNGQDCVQVDPCKSQNDICDPNALCVQEDNLPKCTCNEGYFGDGVTCEDVDECVLREDACELNSTCKNIAGSYLCCTDSGSCQGNLFLLCIKMIFITILIISESSLLHNISSHPNANHSIQKYVHPDSSRLLQFRLYVPNLTQASLFYSIPFYSILFYSILFHCIVFYCTVLYYIVLYCILLHSNQLRSPLFRCVLFCFILLFSFLSYSVLFYSILLCSVLFYAVLSYCIV